MINFKTTGSLKTKINGKKFKDAEDTTAGHIKQNNILVRIGKTFRNIGFAQNSTAPYFDSDRFSYN